MLKKLLIRPDLDEYAMKLDSIRVEDPSLRVENVME